MNPMFSYSENGETCYITPRDVHIDYARNLVHLNVIKQTDDDKSSRRTFILVGHNAASVAPVFELIWQNRVLLTRDGAPVLPHEILPEWRHLT